MVAQLGTNKEMCIFLSQLFPVLCPSPVHLKLCTLTIINAKRRVQGTK